MTPIMFLAQEVFSAYAMTSNSMIAVLTSLQNTHVYTDQSNYILEEYQKNTQVFTQTKIFYIISV